MEVEGLLPVLFGSDLDEAVAGIARSPLAQRYAQVSPDGPEHFPVVLTTEPVPTRAPIRRRR